MNARLVTVLQRRDALVALADEQRAAVAAIVAPWHRALAWLDTGAKVLRAVRRQPALLLLAVSLLASLRHVRLGRWMRRAATAWQVYRALQTELR